MLRRIFPTVLLLLAVLLTGAIVYRSDTYQSCVAGTQGQQVAIYIDCLGQFAHELHGPIAAIATIFLAIFTTTLWWATWNLVRHAQEIERAYVSGGATFDLDIIGQPSKVVVTVDNYGKTPASVSHIVAKLCDSPPTKPDYSGKDLVNMVIRPGREGQPTRLKWQIAGAKGKIVYGRFYYTDIFRKQHSSGFILKVLEKNTVAVEAPSAYTEWD